MLPVVVNDAMVVDEVVPQQNVLPHAPEVAPPQPVILPPHAPLVPQQNVLPHALEVAPPQPVILPPPAPLVPPPAILAAPPVALFFRPRRLVERGDFQVGSRVKLRTHTNPVYIRTIDWNAETRVWVIGHHPRPTGNIGQILHSNMDQISDVLHR